jgi:glucose-1-phosphate adenylyltransferase
MKDTMGLIFTGENDQQLRELTTNRAVAAVPICSRYRIIDFLLSSMVGSGIRNVGVIVQKNYHSLMDHLGSGKEWDLHGKRQGLAILPPFMTADNVGVYSGFMEALHSNLDYLRRCRENYIVVTDSHMLYSTDYSEMVSRHRETGADITLMYTGDRGAARNGRGKYLDMDSNGRVTHMEVDPVMPHYINTYMEVFVLRRELLIYLVDRAISHGERHFTRELLLNALKDGSLRIHGFPCACRAWNIDSVQAYYDCSMDLLDSSVRGMLFSPALPIWTKLRDEMPTRYIGTPKVSNTLLADGCVIEGDVENSILFRGVQVMKGARVKNCIVMQDSRVMNGAWIENCILDKQTQISEDTRLIGSRTYPVMVAKDMTV